MAKGTLDITTRVSEWKKLVGDIEELATRAPASTAYVVFDRIGKYAMERSQELVPVDTGALRSTGILQPPNKGNDYTTTISYGGRLPSVKTNEGKDEVDYAAKVHEATGMKFHHGKVALYLQRAVVDAIFKYGSEGELSAAIRKAMKDKVKTTTLKEVLGSASSPYSGDIFFRKGSRSRKSGDRATERPSRVFRVTKGGK